MKIAILIYYEIANRALVGVGYEAVLRVRDVDGGGGLTAVKMVKYTVKA